MEKFLDVPVYDLVVEGTAVTPVGAADLTDTGNIFAPVVVGDIVHAASSNKYFLVASKIDDNNLTLTALDGGTIPLTAGEVFYIHSATAFNKQIVSIENVKLIEQQSTSTTTIIFDAPSSVDIITLTHLPVPSGSEAMRDKVQDAMDDSYITNWENIASEFDARPYKVIGIAIA